jgi:hypothetical protein
MQRPLIIALVLAGLALSATADAQKLQKPRPRQGYFVTFGLLGAVEHNREDGEGLGVWPGYANSLRLGQMITARLGAGLLIDVGAAEGNDQASTIVGAGLEGQYEVIDNLAIRAGVGLGVVALDDLTQDDEDLRGVYGTAYTLGVSYDWFFTCRRFTGGWAVTPVAVARVIPGSDISAFAAFVGVELSYWSGLPKNQLELSVDEAYR